MAASTALTDVKFNTGTKNESPLFKTGDYVYLKTQYLGTNGSVSTSFTFNAYIIRYVVLQTSSTGAYLDYNGSAADSAPAYTFDVANVDGSGTPDTNVNVPYFFYVASVQTGKTSVFHESQLKTLLGVQLTVAANADQWTNP